MILHLVTDEKFTDYAIKQFSAPEMESEFVLIPSNYTPGNDVVEKEKCRIVKQRSPEFKELLSHLGDYSAIVLHGMHWGGWQTPILESVPEHVKVAWMFWGGDLYGREDIKNTFKAPITKTLYRLHLHGKKPNTSWQISRELFKRVDYCLTGEVEEYEYAKAYIGNPEMKHIWYTYYSMEETVGALMAERTHGDNVWLGNSATAENNFYDAYLRLRLYGLRGRKLISPLSYGAPWVMNSVPKLGRLLFGNKFVPLRTFMPREEYNRLMLDCGTMIMPHYNPQAQGNILTGLWLGMRVYLSEKSIAYNFFKRIGALVFSFESDFMKYRYTPLTDEEVEHNRDVMRKWYSKEHVMQSAVDVVNELKRPKY